MRVEVDGTGKAQIAWADYGGILVNDDPLPWRTESTITGIDHYTATLTVTPHASASVKICRILVDGKEVVKHNATSGSAVLRCEVR